MEQLRGFGGDGQGVAGGGAYNEGSVIYQDRLGRNQDREGLVEDNAHDISGVTAESGSNLQKEESARKYSNRQTIDGTQEDAAIKEIEKLKNKIKGIEL